MEISYKITMGMDTKIWLKTSGGVMIADNNKVPTKECLRYLRMPSGVINPTLDKKYTKMGNSKIIVNNIT